MALKNESSNFIELNEAALCSLGAGQMSLDGAKRYLDRISDFLAEIGREDLNSRLQELKRKLSENELQIVVVGSFKRGKSTLINALVGEPVLPMAVVPLTSVVTLVRCGKEKAANVEFLGGHRENISFNHIPDFVAEDRNPKNEKKVDRVIVDIPSPFLREGTILVDTPGVGSIYRHNTQVAERYFPKADAMILVLSVDPPISELELEFLNSIRRWTKRLYVIVNKVDYFSTEELEQSLRFIRSALRSVLGEGNALLFPISAKRGLEAKKNADAELWRQSGMQSLEDSLNHLMIEGKRNLLRQSVSERAERLLGNLCLEIELELGSLTKAAQDIENQEAVFKQILETTRRRQYELSKLYRCDLKDHIRTMQEDLYEYVQIQLKEITAQLTALYQNICHQSSSKIRSQLNRYFLNSVETSFLRYLEKEEPHWAKTFQEITDRYLENATDMLNESLKEVCAVAKTEHEVVHKPTLIVSPPTVWFVLEEVPIWERSFLPMPTLRMFKSIFLKALKRKVEEAMDVNAGRLRYDYEIRLEATAGEAQKTVEDFFEASIFALKNAALTIASRKTLTQGDLQKKEEVLRARLKTIMGMRNGLANRAPPLPQKK
jgi:GTPase SAR1 family protein